MTTLTQHIDPEVLTHILTHHLSDLPTDGAQTLLDAITALQHHEPQAIHTLINQFQQNPTLDRLYKKSLKTLRQNYTSQERTKSLTLTLQPPQTETFLPELQTLLTQWTQNLQGLLHQRAIAAQKAEQLTVLKVIDKYILSIEELSSTLNRTEDQTRSLVQSLWEKGYIDSLKASKLFILFPFLRSPKYRQKTVKDDEFLTLTTTGFLHLHPIQKPHQRTK